MKRQIAFTIRFDPDLYERVKMTSKREGRSVTAFVQEVVARRLPEEEAAALYHVMVSRRHSLYTRNYLT